MLWKPLLSVILLSVLSLNPCHGKVKRFKSETEAQSYANTEGIEGEEIILAIPGKPEQTITIGQHEEDAVVVEPKQTTPGLRKSTSKLAGVYNNEMRKMTLDTLEQTRKNLESTLTIAQAQNQWNIDAYRNVRKRSATANTYITEQTQNVPVIRSLVGYTNSLVLSPAATWLDGVWEGAKVKIDNGVQSGNASLKKAKSFTSPATLKTTPKAAA